jgi:hypothetical protein
VTWVLALHEGRHEVREGAVCVVDLVELEGPLRGRAVSVWLQYRERSGERTQWRLGLFTGTPWVQLSLTVPVTANTVTAKDTGINPFKSYTVLEYHRIFARPVYLIRVCVNLQYWIQPVVLYYTRICIYYMSSTM